MQLVLQYINPNLQREQNLRVYGQSDRKREAEPDVADRLGMSGQEGGWRCWLDDSEGQKVDGWWNCTCTIDMDNRDGMKCTLHFSRLKTWEVESASAADTQPTASTTSSLFGDTQLCAHNLFLWNEQSMNGVVWE